MEQHTLEYQKWLAARELEERYRRELMQIKDDEKEIYERFYTPLSFGTAGLRGIMRAGLNGVNHHTVARTTQGLAALILECGRQTDGVCIAYDTRNNSDRFARIAACVLAGNGIRVFLFDAPRPTPELSFAIRHLRAVSGINITASHNPKEYNGYKVYWDDGAQMSPDDANTVSERIGATDIFTGIKQADYETALARGDIKIIGAETDERYLAAVLETRVRTRAIPDAAARLNVVFTPLHGTGGVLVPEVLRRAGLKNLYCVEQQMIPDGDFPTVKSPNPENKSCFDLAVRLAKQTDCGLLIGTDPDADRVGVVVRSRGRDFVTLTGNQIGALMTEYILEGRSSNGTLPENACVIKSIVSTALVDKICEKKGVALLKVLTGFKFIGEKIKEFERTGEYSYVFGFEESYGYLPGTYARDKDAVAASLLVTEMAAHYAARNMTLLDALTALYEKYGYTIEHVREITLTGADGAERSREMMRSLRAKIPKEIAGLRLLSFADYLSGEIKRDGAAGKTGLPASDVLCFTLEDGSSVTVRPSGTEPKIKVYYMVSGQTHAKAERARDRLMDAFSALISI